MTQQFEQAVAHPKLDSESQQDQVHSAFLQYSLGKPVKLASIDGAGDSEAMADTKYKNCIASVTEPDGSDATLALCARHGQIDWDAELNSRYNQLKQDLSQPQKNFLEESEQKWIDFRDAEFKNIDKIYAGEPANAETAKMDFVKHRAEELKKRILRDEF
jgi:uncharacterized protein YecT (DUF1311 family)